jgi:hypothetical protein
MVTTEGYMFFPPLVGSDGETQKLKKLNHHSFFGNPFNHWLSGHCNKSLVLFAQDLLVNCLILSPPQAGEGGVRGAIASPVPGQFFKI